MREWCSTMWLAWRWNAFQSSLAEKPCRPQHLHSDQHQQSCFGLNMCNSINKSSSVTSLPFFHHVNCQMGAFHSPMSPPSNPRRRVSGARGVHERKLSYIWKNTHPKDRWMPTILLDLIRSTHTALCSGCYHLWSGLHFRCAICAHPKLEQQTARARAVCRIEEARVFVFAWLCHNQWSCIDGRIKQNATQVLRDAEKSIIHLEMAHRCNWMDIWGWRE